MMMRRDQWPALFWLLLQDLRSSLAEVKHSEIAAREEVNALMKRLREEKEYYSKSRSSLRSELDAYKVLIVFYTWYMEKNVHMVIQYTGQPLHHHVNQLCKALTSYKWPTCANCTVGSNASLSVCQNLDMDDPNDDLEGQGQRSDGSRSKVTI